MTLEEEILSEGIEILLSENIFSKDKDKAEKAYKIGPNAYGDKNAYWAAKKAGFKKFFKTRVFPALIAAGIATGVGAGVSVGAGVATGNAAAKADAAAEQAYNSARYDGNLLQFKYKDGNSYVYDATKNTIKKAGNKVQNTAKKLIKKNGDANKAPDETSQEPATEKSVKCEDVNFFNY